MNKNILQYLLLSFFLTIVFFCNSSSCCANMQPMGGDGSIDYKFADASVLEVSSGPIFDISDGKTVHYRIVVILVEVNMIVYYQQIQYGEENCCLKINFTREISGDDLEGNMKLFSVKNIKWIADDTVQFLGDSTKYTVKLSEKGYKVTKQR